MDTEVMEKINVQLAFEKSHANKLKPMVDTMRNSIVKMLLSRIMYDSLRHAVTFQAIIDVDTGQTIWNVDKQQMIKELNVHIETEKKMIEGTKSIITKVEDNNIRKLLGEIVKDERRHHRLLIRLKEIIESIDVKEQDWEDLYRKTLQEEWPDF